ncbi:MAG: hypothetical protein K6T83_09570 [Alicyclobacillus sp.]|nr:hypothetical protein [Alicyclobacillus sp.]
MNRGGLAGTVFEFDDFATAYSAKAIHDMNLYADEIGVPLRQVRQFTRYRAGRPPTRRLVYPAAAAGAIVVSRHSCSEAMPTREETEQLMAWQR